MNEVNDDSATEIEIMEDNHPVAFSLNNAHNNNKEKSPKKSTTAVSTVVYISGLVSNVSESLVHDYFNKYGDINTINVIKYSGSKRCRGFGYIRYNNDFDQDVLFNEMNNNQSTKLSSKLKIRLIKDNQIIKEQIDNEMNDKTLLKYCQTTSNTDDFILDTTTTIQVSNLPLDANDLMLYRNFSRFGAIDEAHCVFNENGIIDCGLVTYLYSSDAEQAIKTMNNQKIGKSIIKVTMYHKV